MRRVLRARVLLLALLFVLGVNPIGIYGGCGNLYAAAAPRPVVILAEPDFDLGATADGVGTWEPAKPSSLGRYLDSVGYTRGLNLFEVQIRGLRDLTSGALQVSTAIRDVLRPLLALRGSPPDVASPLPIDIVAGGLSGLLARYALENAYLSDFDVVNLVMAASPNRGTFLADVVKSALEIARQEVILERETRSRRFLPSLRDMLGVGDYSEPVSLRDLTKAKGLALPEWEDEASWISTRATTLWEPLYAEYVKVRHFALPYLPVDSPKETYAGWVRRTLPEVWRRLIVDAEWPETSRQDLSLPYYECLAMEVARNQYVMRTCSNASLVKSLLSDPIIPASWEEAALHYGTKILRHYAEKALITVKAGVQEALANQAVKLTGLGSGPDSPFISGLVKEDLLINLGTSSSKRFERIPANGALAAINRSSQALARNRTTRYVSVCSRLANPWTLIWPQLAPNDGLLEVDSSIPPVGPRDLVAVFGGVLRLPGKSVLDDRKAQAYIAGVLSEETTVEATRVGSLVLVDTSSWEPGWCPVEGGRKVTVGVTTLPEGWQCQVWEESFVSREGRGHWKQGQMWAFDEGGNYALRTTPECERLGFRLVRTGPANPVAGNTVRSAFAGETVARVFVAIDEEEVRGETSGPAGGHEGNQPGDPIDSQPGGSNSEPEEPFDEDLPLVRVVYRSKHTTLKKAKETVHGYWEIDFGDGAGEERVDGQPSLTVDHTYASPGSYTATAKSYTDEGKPLYEETWDVSVALAGETRRFSCTSILPVSVNVILSGPAKWVTGKPAVFTIGAEVDIPPNAELVSVKYDPGERFGVIWERAGDFIVGGAVSLIVKYSLEDAFIEVENTYLKEVPVTVLTTGVTY